MVGAGSSQEGRVYLCSRLVGAGDHHDRGVLWQSELESSYRTELMK
jgi:hypothetical protein